MTAPRGGLRRGSRATGLALALALAAALGLSSLGAAELPPTPARWVNDRAGVLSPAAASAIDGKLEAFEQEQGSQVVIAIFERLPEGEALEDYTQRVAEAWKVGRGKEDDGVVLFVFVADRALRIEVGYGLEGTLTDLESKQILDRALTPRLRAGDWDGGIAAAAGAIVEAIRGEYAPSPARGLRSGKGDSRVVFFIVLMIALFITINARRAHRGGGFRGGGRWGGAASAAAASAAGVSAAGAVFRAAAAVSAAAAPPGGGDGKVLLLKNLLFTVLVSGSVAIHVPYALSSEGSRSSG